MMHTPISEVFNFLDYTVNKNFLNTNTAGSRKTACNNLFNVLDDDQKCVEYITKNLDSVVHRFSIKNKDKFTGQTIEVYKSRVKNTLDDFTAWSKDKAAWERSVISRTKQSTSKAKDENVSTGKSRNQNKAQEQEESPQGKPSRKLSFPVSTGFEVKVEIPFEGLTSAELNRLGMFLLPYCNDISSESWNAANWGLVRREK